MCNSDSDIFWLLKFQVTQFAKPEHQCVEVKTVSPTHLQQNLHLVHGLHKMSIKRT